LLKTPAYAAAYPQAPLALFEIERREPRPHDVLVDILFCGVCHSDIHQARDEWGGGIFPMVPGHEIVGRVAKTGASVRGWAPGDVAGVGTLVDSCRECGACKSGEEQYCDGLISFTYNSREQDGRTPTYGGYSTRITIDERFVFRIPKKIPMQSAAPLLCAGVTTYSPLRHYGLKEGDRLVVVGLGGLGHMAVKWGRALGAEVTVMSHTPSKREGALRLGATEFISSQDPDSFESNARRFDFVLDTVSADHDYNSYLRLLRTDGTMIIVGVPGPTLVKPQSLIDRRRRLVGSVVGGVRETQEMLDFADEHGLGADVEVIGIQDINKAFDKTIRGDVKYRFVIDTKSLRESS
jgi:uncharacterized zinc-type alcohol dehydrogenase-like protein